VADSERAIRVFVSSTFRDMQAEREELVKRVFPRIRRLCEERGVGWSEVDLRWGVTDEQKAEGAVLPICLAEIDRSRPFFLGLLGQRYGWVPEELPDHLADQLPWLRSLAGTSVTEMEVLHGVLNDPDAAGHAFFHLRDPGWLATRPAEEQAVLGELPSPEEVEALGAEGAEAAAAERRARLEQLKDRVRSSGLPWATYADPRALGEQVLAELTALVDRLFPADEVPDPIERDDAAHAAYGAARRAGQLERPALAAALDAHAQGDGGPLVLSGPPGSDLTPLVAAWADAWRAGHPDDAVVVHHVGATSDAAGWRNLAARTIAGLDRALDLDGVDVATLPDDAAGVRSALFGALSRAGASGRRSVVVVDGVDLLIDAEGAPDLTWLPLAVPPSVRVVLTTAGPRAVDEARRRGWSVLEAPPLDEGERRAFIATFLARWSKGLDAVHVDRLAAAPQTGSPLFLRTVLDELRQHGDHFTLGEVIERYLAATTVDDLLEQVLARYEGDFERDRPGLVGDAMRALWAARRGLSEPELLELLGGPDEPVPHAVWSPLVLAAEDGLVTRSGLLSFATPLHAKAVEDRYLPTPEAKAAAAGAVAAYFAGQPLGPRVVEELPFAQLAAGDVAAMAATIADPEFLDLAYPQAPRDLRRLWARAEETGHSVVDGYRAVLAAPQDQPERAWAVARLVTDAGHPTEALALNRFLVDHHRAAAAAGEPKGAERLRASLVNLGAACWLQGDLAGAEAPLAEAADLARAAGDRRLTQAAVGNLALVRRDRGDLSGAIALFGEDEAACRELGDTWALQACLGNKAGALRQLGHPAEALAALHEQEALCRAVGEQAGLGMALVGQAAVLADTGDPAAALDRFEAYRAWAVEAGDLRAQAEALINLASTLRQVGRRDEGEARAAEAEALTRRTGDGALLARVLDARARSASEEGRWPDVDRLATEAALTARNADAPAALVLALSIGGTARRELGDLAGAKALHTEELAVATQLGDPAAAATAQVNLGNVALAANDLAGGLTWYAQAEPVLRERHLAMVLVPMLNNRWQVHSMQGNHQAAIADLLDCATQCAAIGAHAQRQQVLAKAIELLYGTGQQAAAGPAFEGLIDACRHTGDRAALQKAIGDYALVVLSTGDLPRAAALLDEQEALCRELGDQVGLAACVGNRAILQRQQGDLAGSLASIDQQLELSRATNNAQGVLFATANRGEVLGAMGRIDEGLAALGEARAMAAQWNLAPMVQQLDQMIAALRAGQN
jgi:tetratricopeptide (TPR) repeat protein